MGWCLWRSNPCTTAPDGSWRYEAPWQESRITCRIYQNQTQRRHKNTGWRWRDKKKRIGKRIALVYVSKSVARNGPTTRTWKPTTKHIKRSTTQERPWTDPRGLRSVLDACWNIASPYNSSALGPGIEHCGTAPKQGYTLSTSAKSSSY